MAGIEHDGDVTETGGGVYFRLAPSHGRKIRISLLKLDLIFALVFEFDPCLANLPTPRYIIASRSPD